MCSTSKALKKIRDLQRVAVEESRLGIPLLFGMDVVHGYETVFPIPLGLSCTWDMEAVETSARIAAREASSAGICWTFSPMVDICRDPRWGRASEGSGEDPFLGAAVARAMVKGYQGDDNFKSNDEIMACVKHFALYGAPEGGRDLDSGFFSKVGADQKPAEADSATVDLLKQLVRQHPELLTELLKEANGERK